MFDDAAPPSGLGRRHRQDPWAHGRHLRPIVQGQDGTKERAAKRRPCCRERAFIVDRKLRAVGREPRKQSRRHGSGKIAPQRRRTEEQNLGVVGLDEIRHGLGVGLIAIMSERRIGHRIDDIRAIFEAFIGNRRDGFAIAAHDDAGQFDTSLVRQLTALA